MSRRRRGKLGYVDGIQIVEAGTISTVIQEWSRHTMVPSTNLRVGKDGHTIAIKIPIL